MMTAKNLLKKVASRKRLRLRKLNKEKRYFVYCRTGRRSANATLIMKQMGFKNVCNVEGGVVMLTRNGVKLTQ